VSYQPQYIRDTLTRMKARLDAEGLVPDQRFLATLVEYAKAIEQGSASWYLGVIHAEINRLRREQWRS
jgi:hypothetical protein